MSSADLDGSPRHAPIVAESARLLGEVVLGHGSVVAQGTVVRSPARSVRIGQDSAVLENSVVVGSPRAGVSIGARSVLGHRAVVLDASVGDLCEIGNGTIILPGAHLGDRVFTGEGTLVPPGVELPDESVAVGRPARVVRRANARDLDRLRGLRGGDLDLPPPLPAIVGGPDATTGAALASLHPYRDRMPDIDPTALLFDSAEITGDVTVGARTIIGAGVRIIGDSHGPVRIGADVQILENSVLHLLPDNELVLEDGVVVGPACMIHGCRVGAGTVVEPAAIVCDGSRIGAGSRIEAGSCVKQGATFGDGVVVAGFPARVVDGAPPPAGPPPWALAYEDVATLVR